jgi:hypothetical protein
MLEPRYRQMLIDAVNPTRIEKEDYVFENPKLEQAIKQVKFECPTKFHSSQTLADRMFYDEPASPKAPISHSGFVRKLSMLNRY